MKDLSGTLYGLPPVELVTSEETRSTLCQSGHSAVLSVFSAIFDDLPFQNDDLPSKSVDLLPKKMIYHLKMMICCLKSQFTA